MSIATSVRSRRPLFANASLDYCGDRYERTKKRLGRQRGPKVARVDLARELAKAIWHALSENEALLHPLSDHEVRDHPSARA